MQYDFGSTAQVIVVLFSVGFGAVAQLIAGHRATHWLWLAGALGWLVGAVVMSEVVFATATIDQIHPIIDGLAFDEALLGGLVGGLLAVFTTLALTRHPAQRAGRDRARFGGPDEGSAGIADVWSDTGSG